MVSSTSKTSSSLLPHGPVGYSNPVKGAPAVPMQWDIGTVVARSLLDHAEREFVSAPESVFQTMETLMTGLTELRSAMASQDWSNICAQCIAHPVRELIHQDPFLARSFNKPRGYAGDAVLIDYIYSGYEAFLPDAPVTPLGEQLFRFSYQTPTCAAVRARRDLIAAVIDEVCTVVDHPQILSVACGHLREASLSRSVAAHQAGRFIALDQDELSLAVIARGLQQYGVVPIRSSIKSLFRGDIAREQFDLIYSTGLYDYLDDRMALKLTTRLFEMLNPGGRLLIANFLTDIFGAGMMETFMGWNLIYRTSRQMYDLGRECPDSQVASRRTFVERNQNIVFLEIIRR